MHCWLEGLSAVVQKSIFFQHSRVHRFEISYIPKPHRVLKGAIWPSQFGNFGGAHLLVASPFENSAKKGLFQNPRNQLAKIGSSYELFHKVL